MEGEVDALTVGQVAGDLVVPVATGSTSGSRRPRWIARLALCPLVLVGFDTDEPGCKAAQWWLDVLSNAKRWRPYWGDANAMAQDGADVRSWVMAGLSDIQPQAAEEDPVAKVESLFREPDPETPEAQLKWCRRYAAIMTEMGAPSTSHNTWPAWLTDMEAYLSSHGTSHEHAEPRPAWVGRRVPIEDLTKFKQHYSLRTVGGDPDLYGEPWEPKVYLTEP